MRRIFLMTLTVAILWSGSGTNAAQSPAATGQSMQTPAQTPSPCCAITNVDNRSGEITAQQISGGQAFQFIAPPKLVPNLRVGQKVWVNSKTLIVSVEGAANCCRVAQASGGAPTGSFGQAAKSGTKSRGGLDSIKPGDIPPVTASPEPTTAGAIRGRPATPSSGTQDRGAK